MYKTLILALALAAPAMATLPLVLTTSTAAGVTTATTTLLAAPAVTGLLGAAVIVKGIGLGLLLRDAGKKKRDVSGGPKSLGLDSSFAIISQLEPAQCIRRLICDVASGALPADESDEVILAPFAAVNRQGRLGNGLLTSWYCKKNGDGCRKTLGTSLADADVASHSFDYLVAVENGKNFGSVEKCELRYSCPLSAGQLRQIFNEA